MARLYYVPDEQNAKIGNIYAVTLGDAIEGVEENFITIGKDEAAKFVHDGENPALWYVNLSRSNPKLEKRKDQSPHFAFQKSIYRVKENPNATVLVAYERGLFKLVIPNPNDVLDVNTFAFFITKYQDHNAILKTVMLEKPLNGVVWVDLQLENPPEYVTILVNSLPEMYGLSHD